MRKPSFEDFFGRQECARKPFYNFGAGNWRHPNFQNIDLLNPNYPNNKPDVCYDAYETAPFPIGDGEARIFYISQVNEHLSDRINRHIFSEMARTLAKGGVLRIAYPSFERALRAYRESDRAFFLWSFDRGPDARKVRQDHDVAQLFLDFFATRAQKGSPDDGNRKYASEEFAALVDELGAEAAAGKVCAGLNEQAQRAAPGCHCNYWTFDKIKEFLLTAGFSEVRRCAYLQSSIPPMRDPNFFDQTLPAVSGYVEATK